MYKFISLFLSLWLIACQSEPSQPYTFEISIDPDLIDQNTDGRLLLMFSSNNDAEPRYQIVDGYDTQLIFGIDVEDWTPGQKLIMDPSAFGYPIEKLQNIKPGKYYVQALINRYETFNLASGHTVKLPPEKGEGQQWNRKPGNLFNEPVQLDVKKGAKYHIVIDKKIPDIELPKDTRYIKHVKMKNERLSEFWGQDIFLGANVLLPHEWERHPNAQFPLMIFHGHFPYTFGGFREDPPDPDLVPDYSERFNLQGYNIIQQQEAHDFYTQWTSSDFPRFIIIEIQHANPYYDDSYAVNSANIGPYGDAITYDLIPFIEKEFRGLGEGWARFLYGGSTGGWEALAAQVMYPDEYNGCFAACPDPIDFAAFCLVNIYDDENAYYYNSEYKNPLVPGHRDYLGNVNASLKDMNHRELALGDKNRSGQQWDIWEAVYSPMGSDGYPERLWDKYTGEINHEIAEYWKENFDLRHILQRDWDKIGQKLKGKIHIYCGDMDNYYLNNSVYLMEEFLESTKDPYYDGEVLYGDRAEHCWNGDYNNPNHISRLRYNTMYIPKILDRIKKSAPQGADLKSWRYRTKP